jgi:hypothetical protein
MLLAFARYPFNSRNNALGIGIMPKNFTYSFQLCIKTFFTYILEMPHIHALAFAKMAEIACKTGHFAIATKFNV